MVGNEPTDSGDRLIAGRVGRSRLSQASLPCQFGEVTGGRGVRDAEQK